MRVKTKAPLKVRMTISQFLNEYTDSHAIQSSPQMKAKFRELTGLEPKWPEYSTRETAAAIRGRGLGGAIDMRATEPNCWGYVVAESLAREYADYPGSAAMGRGRRFRDAVEALRKAGK